MFVLKTGAVLEGVNSVTRNFVYLTATSLPFFKNLPPSLLPFTHLYTRQFVYDGAKKRYTTGQDTTGPKKGHNKRDEEEDQGKTKPYPNPNLT